MCNSNDLLKQDGMYVCQCCGTKYTVEEAKKLMVEGTVRIDNSEELANLYQLARRAKNEENCENAAKYYDSILVKDPMSWEAAFYLVYYKASSSPIQQIKNSTISVSNSFNSIFSLIRDYVANKEMQIAAYTEVASRVIFLYTTFDKRVTDNHQSMPSGLRPQYFQEMIDRRITIVNCLYALGNSLIDFFPNDPNAYTLAVQAWKESIKIHSVLINKLKYKKENRATMNKAIALVQKYEPTYEPPKVSGCYVATAVYGSYDCAEVWTLRRFRDDTLASTWYGRAFIKTYYAISPTLVKWFGNTQWFKKMWKPTLDKMVRNLNNKGVENTPYNDKQW